ncbi:MAG: hypothetical protein NTX52_11695 [Planctomycetota bacterium]|nr:hypothetical protein [Planctomycetota bacterium]
MIIKWLYAENKLFIAEIFDFGLKILKKLAFLSSLTIYYFLKAGRCSDEIAYGASHRTGSFYIVFVRLLPACGGIEIRCCPKISEDVILLIQQKTSSIEPSTRINIWQEMST